MACISATEALVEVGTVPLRAVRVSVASIIMCSVGDSVGTMQCVGYITPLLQVGEPPRPHFFLLLMIKHTLFGSTREKNAWIS